MQVLTQNTSQEGNKATVSVIKCWL